MVWPASEAHVRTKLRAAVLRRACRWQAAPSTPDEEARLAALYKLDILDTGSEPRFDRFTEAACKHFNVPISFITLVDRDRQWFKSRRGLEPPESPRDQSMCAHAILGDDVFQVSDALADDRFAENPNIARGARIRFYAGVPITVDDEHVGSFCIMDHRPRVLDDDELERLRQLGHMVEAELASYAEGASAN